MSPYRQQRLFEGQCDLVAAVAFLVLFFAFLALLPARSFPWWFVPLTALWVRWHIVRQRRDERYLRAEEAELLDGSEAGTCWSRFDSDLPRVDRQLGTGDTFGDDGGEPRVGVLQGFGQHRIAR